MRIILIDDIKNVQSFKSGYELVEYEAGTDPMDGFCLMGFNEIGMFCTNPQYAFLMFRDEIGNLMNDLAMLIEAKECYNETYYNSEYKRITNRLVEIGEYT